MRGKFKNRDKMRQIVSMHTKKKDTAKEEE